MDVNEHESYPTFYYTQTQMKVIEHERLSNITLGH